MGMCYWLRSPRFYTFIPSTLIINATCIMHVASYNSAVYVNSQLKECVLFCPMSRLKSVKQSTCNRKYRQQYCPIKSQQSYHVTSFRPITTKLKVQLGVNYFSAHCSVDVSYNTFSCKLCADVHFTPLHCRFPRYHLIRYTEIYPHTKIHY